MERVAVQYLLIVIFGMLIFIGLERLLQPFLVNPLYMILIGGGLIFFAKKFPFKIGIPRVVGGIILFITLKPFLVTYISSAYIFIGMGVAGMFFLPKMTTFLDKYI